MKTMILSVVLFAAGFCAKGQSFVKAWETDSIFSGPESVAYDESRELLYVSNLRKSNLRDIYYADDFISKVHLSGEVIALKWITELTEPSGIEIFKDRLYIVERFGVVVYNLAADRVEKRMRINTNNFLNDITVADDGTIYVSESDTDKVYVLKNESVSIWHEGDVTSRTNGLLFHNGNLIAGVNADSTVKVFDAKGKTLKGTAEMARGIIDGIQPIENDYLVSFFEGQLFRVSANGDVREVMDSRGTHNIADFRFIESKKLLVIPALWQHKLIAYKLNE